MPAGAVTLFHLRGIRIGADYSWFLVLFLMIWSLSGLYEDVVGKDSAFVLATASALLFFASVVLHEMGHALVGHYLEFNDPIHKITIVSRGQALGLTVSLPTEDRYLTTRTALMQQMAMMLGGRAAAPRGDGRCDCADAGDPMVDGG